MSDDRFKLVDDHVIPIIDLDQCLYGRRMKMGWAVLAAVMAVVLVLAVMFLVVHLARRRDRSTGMLKMDIVVSIVALAFTVFFGAMALPGPPDTPNASSTEPAPSATPTSGRPSPSGQPPPTATGQPATKRAPSPPGNEATSKQAIRTSAPAPPHRLTATIRCAPCSTDQRTITMTGTISGPPADGHRVRIFNNTGGTYFGGRDVGDGNGGPWTSQTYVGNDRADGPPTILYDICLYDICLYDVDAAFTAYLDGRSDKNAAMTKFPAAGTAKRLACVSVTWHRPTS
ncbi:hypothetical protein WEI85_05570 [Actinomycetes bacterium KLBMP 9797]